MHIRRPAPRHPWLWAGLIVIVVSATLGTSLVVRAASAGRADPCAGAWVACRGASRVDARTAEPPSLVPFARAFRLTRSGEGQTIDVRGANLAPGMTARLVSPVGSFVSTYDQRAMSGVTAEAFRLTARFDEPGIYLLSVRSQGSRSNEIPVVVK
jgi:hypothetical protein